jgi:transketolase
VEAVKAAEVLDADGIRARVIDCYSLKPIDGDTLALAAAQTRAVLTVEDHWPEGGLGDAVLDALAACPDRPVVRKLAVSGMPVSGKPGELLHAAHIDAEAVVEAARQLVKA